MSNAQAELGDMYGKPITRRDIGKKCGHHNCPTRLNAYNTGGYCYVHQSEMFVKHKNNPKINYKERTIERINKWDAKKSISENSKNLNISITLARIYARKYGLKFKVGRLPNNTKGKKFNYT